MHNGELAAVLAEIARLLELDDEDPRRVRAFTSASRALQRNPEPFSAASDPPAVFDAAGIDADLTAEIVALLRAGPLAYLESLHDALPEGVLAMLHVPKLGVRHVRHLHEQLGIHDLDALERACVDNRLAGERTFSDKLQARILKGIARYRHYAGQLLLPQAERLAARLAARLESQAAVERVILAGRTRRFWEMTTMLELVASGDAPAAIAALEAQPGVRAVLDRHAQGVSVHLSENVRVRLRVVDAGDFGDYALQRTHSTGRGDAWSATRKPRSTPSCKWPMLRPSCARGTVR